MRVISQSGMVDLPYENVAITVDKAGEYVIHGHTAYEDKSCLLAKYSTEEKALKAMEQLRVAYMNCEYFSRVISGTATMDMPNEKAIVDFRNLLQSARESCVFQLPADEDLEV